MSALTDWYKAWKTRPDNLKALVKQGHTLEEAEDIIDRWATDRKIARRHSRRRKRRQ